MSWPSPRKLTDLRSFVGLAGYYKRFTEEHFAGKYDFMYGLRNPAGELVVPWPFLKTAGRMA